jgi:apolipoprotein N-acyltransferase
MDFLPLIQVASVTGLWGISFILFLFAGTVAALFSGAGKLWQRRVLAITVGFLVSAVLVFGEWRLQSNSPAKSVHVTLIAKDVPMSVYLGSEGQALDLLHEYADEIRRVTPAGTQAVVLPEKIGRLSESALAEVDARCFLRQQILHVLRLSLASFGEPCLSPLILPGFIRPMEN